MPGFVLSRVRRPQQCPRMASYSLVVHLAGSCHDRWLIHRVTRYRLCVRGTHSCPQSLFSFSFLLAWQGRQRHFSSCGPAVSFFPEFLSSRHSIVFFVLCLRAFVWFRSGASRARTARTLAFRLNLLSFFSSTNHFVELDEILLLSSSSLYYIFLSLATSLLWNDLAAFLRRFLPTSSHWLLKST